MPEGDTLFRIAATLQRALGGARVTAFRSPEPLVENALALQGPLDGLRVPLVEARGKNLLIHFEDGRVLRSHLRMSGSWHIYRAGEKWQRPLRQMRAELRVDNGFVAVLFNAPIVELLTAAGLRRSDLRLLGPDATTDAFDQPEALRRLRARPSLSLAEALLDQTALAGIGNVIKSETLFRCRLDPFTPVGSLAEEALARLVADAHGLLLRNRGGGPRTTRDSLDGGRLWVYHRSGEPCFVCGETIRLRRVGAALRSTYYCSVCQRSAAERPLSPAGDQA